MQVDYKSIGASCLFSCQHPIQPIHRHPNTPHLHSPPATISSPSLLWDHDPLGGSNRSELDRGFWRLNTTRIEAACETYGVQMQHLSSNLVYTWRGYDSTVPLTKNDLTEREQRLRALFWAMACKHSVQLRHVLGPSFPIGFMRFMFDVCQSGTSTCWKAKQVLCHSGTIDLMRCIAIFHWCFTNI